MVFSLSYSATLSQHIYAKTVLGHPQNVFHSFNPLDWRCKSLLLCGTQAPTPSLETQHSIGADVRPQGRLTNRNGFVTYPCPYQLCGLEQVMLPQASVSTSVKWEFKPHPHSIAQRRSNTKKWILFSFCSIISLLSKHSLCWTCCDNLIRLMRVHESKKKQQKKNLGGFLIQGQTGYKSFQGIYIWLGLLTNKLLGQLLSLRPES